MQGILTITLNPALDLATSVAEVVPGPKLRCGLPLIDAGGGGVNVSRAIRSLGGDSTALVAIGGLTGNEIATRLEAEGIRLVRFSLSGDTRISFAVTDRGTGAQFRFMLPGPLWVAAEQHGVLAKIKAAVPPSGLVVLSGSQPPGVAANFAAELAQMLVPTGGRLVVDTSGTPLKALAQARANPFLLRLDGPEAEDLAGSPLPTRQASLDFAAELVARKVAQVVVLARGAEGSVLAAPGHRLFCPAAKVRVISKIGAGDSFVAAFALSLSRNDSLAAALEWGTAAASAAVTSDGTGLCRRQDVERLRSQCRVEAD